MTQVAQIFEEEKQQALLQEEITSLVYSYSQDDVEMLRSEIAGK